MTYKTTRNKTLQNITRLIMAEYHGDIWSAPDGYFAINRDIYSDYKTKKSQDAQYTWNVGHRPILDDIIDNNVEYTFAQMETEADDDEYIDIKSTENAITYRCDKRWLECIRAYYPNALAFTPTDNDKYKHVKMFDGGELVAIIMPVKQ